MDNKLFQLDDFIMNKKIMSLREHYDFQDRTGSKFGEGDGNFIQFPAKFDVIDLGGSKLMSIEGKLISLRHEFTFHDNMGQQIGAIKKKLLKLIGEEYWVEQNGKEFMRIYGNFTEHDYKFEVNKQLVAFVHKKWISIRDSFCVSITGNVDHRLIIGAAIVIEHVEVREDSSHHLGPHFP